uniref:Uncharacterized protein n=1 Tax=Acrobeloides nanus TaxID=290746 RepID=A0A914CT50_9BILA
MSRLKKSSRNFGRSSKNKPRRKTAQSEEERGRPDELDRWDIKKKKIEHLEAVDEEQIYGVNGHFNKKRKEKEEPKFNVRPDFEKADLRDIEIFKACVKEIAKKKGIKMLSGRKRSTIFRSDLVNVLNNDRYISFVYCIYICKF